MDWDMDWELTEQAKYSRLSSKPPRGLGHRGWGEVFEYNATFYFDCVKCTTSSESYKFIYFDCVGYLLRHTQFLRT
jgi:hypothetical protein